MKMLTQEEAQALNSGMGGEPLNTPKVKPDLPAGTVMVNHPSGTFAYIPPIGPVEGRTPWDDGPPSDEDYAGLLAASANADEYLTALTVERAALPQLRSEAVINGNAGELTRLRTRDAELPAEIQLGSITAARARLALLQGQKALAKARRDEASNDAYRLGLVNGYPEGKAKGDLAAQAHGNASIDYSYFGRRVGEAVSTLAQLLQEAGV